MIRAWYQSGADEIEAAKGSPGVMPAAKAERNLEERVSALHAVADRIYDRWCESLSRA
jgi:hypothetical protein